MTSSTPFKDAPVVSIVGLFISSVILVFENYLILKLIVNQSPEGYRLKIHLLALLVCYLISSFVI